MLREQIEELAKRQGTAFTAADRSVFDDFKSALNRGEIRAAEKTSDGEWRPEQVAFWRDKRYSDPERLDSSIP